MREGEKEGHKRRRLGRHGSDVDWSDSNILGFETTEILIWRIPDRVLNIFNLKERTNKPRRHSRKMPPKK